MFPGLLCPAAAGPDGGICSKVFLVTAVGINGMPERVGTRGLPAHGEASVLQPKTTVSDMEEAPCVSDLSLMSTLWTKKTQVSP